MCSTCAVHVMLCIHSVCTSRVIYILVDVLLYNYMYMYVLLHLYTHTVNVYCIDSCFH